MRCPKCGNEVNDSNQFCPYCGARLVKKDEQAIRFIKEIRLKQISFVMNRLLNISTIIAIVFAIIGVFGPVILTTDNTEIGGLQWFSSTGWRYLNEGLIAIGPFYTTFALYILLFLIVITIGAFGIYKAINGIRRNEECKTIPHIISLSLVHSVYSAFVNNFYYEYTSQGDYYFEAGSGWGVTVYSLAIPLFIIALMIYLVMKAVLTASNNKKIVRHIFALVSTFALASSISSIYTILAYQDIEIFRYEAYGTLKYFEVISNMPINVITLIIISFILSTLLMGIIIAFVITTLRNLVKYDKINRPLLLSLGISQAVIVFMLIIIEVLFGNAVNSIEGWSYNFFHLTSNFILIILASMLVLGFSIAIFAMGEDKKVDDNIIDQKVISKDIEE